MVINNTIPISVYSSEEICIDVYNTVGKLKLKIISSYIQYWENKKITWFLNPKIFLLNEKNIIILEILCNQAKLNYKKSLILDGYVYINKMLNNKHIQSIITNYAIINFINQDITTKTKTIIHDYAFYSIGSELYFNLNTQKIDLCGKVYTQYENQGI